MVSISIIMISISLQNQPLFTWTTTMKSMIMLAMVPVELSISFSNFLDPDLSCNFYYPDYSKPIDIVARNFRWYATEKFPARVFDAAFVMSKWQLAHQAHQWGRDNFLDSHRNR